MSANFPIFHGITLADGATLDNLKVEVLASDPNPVGAGRIWFNTTERKLKYSTLNSTNGVIVVAHIVAADLATATSASQLYTDDAIAALVGSAPEILNTLQELATSIHGDGDVWGSVLGKIADAKAEIQDGVSGAFDTLAEVETALGVINGGNTVDGSIAKAVKTEKDRAEGAEGILTNNVATINGSDVTDGSFAKAVKEERVRATGVEGALLSLTTNEKGTLVAAVNDVDARLGTVETLVNGKIGTLTELTTVAQNDLVAAINEVDAQRDETALALATEITNRTNAVSGEASTRSTAINEDRARLNTIEGSGVGSIAAAIVAEALDRTTAASEEQGLRLAAEGLEAETRSTAIAADRVRLTKIEGSASTEGSIAYAVAAEASTRFADDNTLTAAIALLNNADDTVTGSVAKAVKTEYTRATNAESALGTRIDNVLSNVTPGSLDSLSELVTAFQAADTDLLGAIGALSSGASSSLADEISRATGAEEAIADDLADEISRATGAEGLLSGAVTLLNNTAATPGSVAYKVAAEKLERTTAASEEQGLRLAAEEILTDDVALINGSDITNGSFAYAVKTERVRALGAEEILTDAVTKLNDADTVTGSVAQVVKTERVRALGAEEILTNNVATINGSDVTDGSFAKAVKTERVRALGAEEILTNNVATINGSDVTNGSFAKAVKTERDDRIAADIQIRTDINAGNVTFQSGAEATTHTFTHNLNSDFITFSVMVLRADGKYRNDIVSVEAYDANTLKIYLTEASHVRVSAVSMTSL
jgi:hypothetical protein